MSQKKIIVYGGTFDPVHMMHIYMPFKVLEHLCCDNVLYVPCYMPPHKDRKITNDFHRINMLKIALKNKNQFLIEDFEIREKGVSYTIKTLEYLKSIYSDCIIYLLIGSDNALIFNKWKKVDEIVKIAKPVTIKRPGYEINDWQYDIIEMEEINISSSALRDKLYQKMYNDPLIKNYLDPNVLDYIIKNGLYE